MKNPDYYKRCSVIVKALAHPDRLLILDALSRKELCVCDLIKLVKTDQSTVSKHLLLLKNAGLVDCRKKGLYVIYRLKAPCVTQFFGCIERAFEQGKGSVS